MVEAGWRPVAAMPAAAYSQRVQRVVARATEFRRFRRTQLWEDWSRHSVGISHLSSQVTFRNQAKKQSANGLRTPPRRKKCAKTGAAGDRERRSPILYPVLSPSGKKLAHFCSAYEPCAVLKTASPGFPGMKFGKKPQPS